MIILFINEILEKLIPILFKYITKKREIKPSNSRFTTRNPLYR